MSLLEAGFVLSVMKVESAALPMLPRLVFSRTFWIVPYLSRRRNFGPSTCTICPSVNLHRQEVMRLLEHHLYQADLNLAKAAFKVQVMDRVQSTLIHLRDNGVKVAKSKARIFFLSMEDAGLVVKRDYFCSPVITLAGSR